MLNLENKEKKNEIKFGLLNCNADRHLLSVVLRYNAKKSGIAILGNLFM